MSVTSSAPARKLYISQNVIFSAHAISQPCRVDTQPVERFERAMRCTYDIKFRLLQVRKNEIHFANALVVLRICAPQREH